MAIPAAATTFSIDYAYEGLSPDQYEDVICEQKLGRHLCCVKNEGDTRPQCGMNELRVCDGFGRAHFCPSTSKKRDFTWPAKNYVCPLGMDSFFAGVEHEDFFIWAGCKFKSALYRSNEHWCCPSGRFAPEEGVPLMQPRPRVSTPAPTGALLVLSDRKWQVLKYGGFKSWGYEQAAYEFEQQRCSMGGGNIRIIDPKYGSYFKDTRNIHPGARAFYFTKEKIIPLLTWC